MIYETAKRNHDLQTPDAVQFSLGYEATEEGFTVFEIDYDLDGKRTCETELHSHSDEAFARSWVDEAIQMFIWEHPVF